MRLSLTTPGGSLVDTEVDEIVAPGAVGEFGVLPGHIPFLCALKPGVLACHNHGQGHAPKFYAVGQGVLQVVRSGEHDKIIVLVDQAIGASEIQTEAAATELAGLDREIAAWKSDDAGSLPALISRRDWAAAQVNAAARVGTNN